MQIQHDPRRARLKLILTLLSLALSALAIWWANNNLSSYYLRILNLAGINAILAVSMNLIFGFTGLFSLGHAGFMAVGAYTCALLTLPMRSKQTIFLLAPLAWPFNAVTLPPFPAVLLAGLAAAVMAYSSVCPCCAFAATTWASPPWGSPRSSEWWQTTYPLSPTGHWA